jgi:tetratricopeptide (TPR) repeat protein
VIAQAGRGLAAAHARGLVHRDFKPDNVLVDKDGRARVVDFGLASESLGDVSLDCKLIRATASMSGTPAYMAPELVDGGTPDARSDIYAVAVTLFEALHGRHPFAGGTVETIWIEMAAGRIREGQHRIPAWLDRAVRRGLAVDPRDRWPTLSSFVAAIDRTPRRNRYIAASAFGGFAAVTVAAFAFAPQRSDDCSSGATLVDRIWNPNARISLLGSLSRDPVIASSTVRLVDHWSETWKLDRTASCSAEHRIARTTCLDHQIDEVRNQLALWAAHPDTGRAIQVASTLPTPSACATTSDTPIAARSIVLRDDEIKALWRNGRSSEAAPKLAALVRDAEAIGHHDTLAQTLLDATLVETDLGDMDAVGRDAARAATEASKAGDDATLYAALIQQAYNRIDTGQPADALGICDAADAIAARGVPLPEKVMIARAGALIRLGRVPEAIAQYQKAIAMAEPHAASDPLEHISLGIAIAGLGNAYLEAEDWNRAKATHQRALAIQQVDYGPNHPEIARTLRDMAEGESASRDLDAAVVDYEHARRILVASFGEKHPEVGEIDVSLATVAQHRHDPVTAKAMLIRANTELGGVLPPTHQIFSVIEGQLGEIEQNSDHCDAAVPHYEKALEIVIADHLGGSDAANIEGSMALCLIDSNKVVEAKVRAESALENLARAGVKTDKSRVASWFVLALVADAQGDRAKALHYAELVMKTTQQADMRAQLRAKHLTAS